MKKIKALIISLFVVVIILYSMNSLYKGEVKNSYNNKMGDSMNQVKNEGIILQRSAIESGDNLFMFGSSELGTNTHPFHPSTFFANKKDGFQVNLIGRGHYQSIIHTMNIGALGKELENQKVVYIISPQWFTKAGLSPDEFKMGFSQLQFYKFMDSNDIDKSMKLRVASRIKSLAGGNGSLGDIMVYCDLYEDNNILSSAVLYGLRPYYKLMEYIFSIKDEIKSNELLKVYKNQKYEENKISSSFDWVEERKKAALYAKNITNNNDFLIGNDYYNTNIRDKIGQYKDCLKGASYSISPEYDDLKLFLDTCSSMGIKPLVISVPMHGKWYDYSGFDKSNRQDYYKKVNALVAAYGFELADFSKYEYEEYFLADIMHLGWKGWVYIDEAIDKYYHEK